MRCVNVAGEINMASELADFSRIMVFQINTSHPKIKECTQRVQFNLNGSPRGLQRLIEMMEMFSIWLRQQGLEWTVFRYQQNERFSVISMSR